MSTSDKKNVLIVDDDKHLVKLLTFLFVGNGFKVKSAENGLVGIELLERNIPDVIILDLMMPGMDGYEFLTQIKKDYKLRDIKVIVLSALTESAARKKVLSLGAYDYFEKPFKSSVLVKKVIEAIEDKDSE